MSKELILKNREMEKVKMDGDDHSVHVLMDDCVEADDSMYAAIGAAMVYQASSNEDGVSGFMIDDFTGEDDFCSRMQKYQQALNEKAEE